MQLAALSAAALKVKKLEIVGMQKHALEQCNQKFLKLFFQSRRTRQVKGLACKNFLILESQKSVKGGLSSSSCN